MAGLTAYTVVRMLLGFLFIALATAQCPNELAVYNPMLRTTCTNGSKFFEAEVDYHSLMTPAYFIVPVDTTLVANAVKPYNLLTPPASLFPNGFPAGTHPVLVTDSLESDIRMSTLQLPTSLLEGAIRVPYVDRLGDGKTPFQYSIHDYISGVNGQDISGFVPGRLPGSLSCSPLKDSHSDCGFAWRNHRPCSDFCAQQCALAIDQYPTSRIHFPDQGYDRTKPSLRAGCDSGGG